MPDRHRQLPEPLLARLSEFLAAHTGLDFGGIRQADLERAMCSAARQAGQAEVEFYVRALLGSPLTRPQVERLASHLTVGETYFFREKEALAALEQQVIAPLLRSGSRGERRLRIWSAGCSTGEEPYSIAMTLARSIPDLGEWNVSILATDINPLALRKAAAGIYGEWSFRSTPADLKSSFFRQTVDGCWQVSERIRSMVSFEYLNLAQDSYPSVANATNAMDAIFCRNVLMYFNPARAQRVLEDLGLCLLPEGWLFLNPIEVSRLAVPQLRAVNVAGSFAYRRAVPEAPRIPETPSPAPSDRQWLPTWPLPRVPKPVPEPVPQQTPYERATALYARGDYAAVTDVLLAHASDAPAMALLARAHANQGRLADALAWCEKAVAADRLNAAWYYLHSTILQEQGMNAECETALQRALYLNPDQALAHFALGNLRRHQGRHEQSRRDFRNALSALDAYAKDDPLPEAEGMSAGRLAEIVRATLASEAVE